MIHETVASLRAGFEGILRIEKDRVEVIDEGRFRRDLIDDLIYTAVLSADDWEALIDWLEEAEDAQAVREAYQALQAADGDRRRAGWVEWKSVTGKLG